MSIRVQFMGPLANAIRTRETVLAGAAGMTLRELLDRLEARYGAEFGHRVFRTEPPPGFSGTATPGTPPSPTSRCPQGAAGRDRPTCSSTSCPGQAEARGE